MRTDLVGWEKYDALLDEIVAQTVEYQERRNHPMVPALSLHLAAEAAFAWTDKRKLAMTYGDLNAGTLGLTPEKGTAHEALLHIVSRAIVADARMKPQWVQYLKENEHRWPQLTKPPKPSE